MAYQAKRNKRFEEDFELVDENGVVQHTLKVSLDADDMVAKINRKYTALVRALSDVQEIKRKEASNEQLSDAVEMLGRAEIDMFEVAWIQAIIYSIRNSQGYWSWYACGRDGNCRRQCCCCEKRE